MIDPARLKRLDHWAKVVDVLAKVLAMVAVAAAGYYFLFSTEVRVGVSSQQQIDVDAVVEGYEQRGEVVPPVVIDIANEYNRQNLDDLQRGANLSTEEPPTIEDLCDGDAGGADLTAEQRRQIVEAVIGSGCEAKTERTRFFERRLAQEALRDPAGFAPDQAGFAKRVFQASGYRRAAGVRPQPGRSPRRDQRPDHPVRWLHPVEGLRRRVHPRTG